MNKQLSNLLQLHLYPFSWRVLSCLLFLPFLITGVSALAIAEYPFNLTGEVLEFNEETGNITASGNIKIKYNQYRIYSDTFYYDKGKGSMLFQGNIKLVENKHIVYSDRLVFNIHEKKGRLDGLNSYIEDFYLDADLIRISSQNIVLSTASFSPCDLTSGKHLAFKSREIELDLAYGYISAKSMWAHFLNIPFFYWPKASYRSSSQSIYSDVEESEDTGLRSVPKLGSDSINGSFLKLYYSYDLSPKIFGAFKFGYTDKRGFLAGVSQQFVLPFSHRLTLKGTVFTEDRFSGGGIYHVPLFLNKSLVQSEVGFFDNIIRRFSKADMSSALLTLKYLDNEVINNELVDIKPSIKLESEEIKLPFKAMGSASISYGHYTDQQASAKRFQAQTFLSKEIWSLKPWDFNVHLYQGNNWYSSNQLWHRSYGISSLRYKSTFFEPTLFYTHLFLQRGGSPFLFDSNNEVTNNELGLTLQFNWKSISFITEFRHFFYESKDEVSYEIVFRNHCWQWSFKVDPIWDAITFNIGLI